MDEEVSNVSNLDTKSGLEKAWTYFLDLMDLRRFLTVNWGFRLNWHVDITGGSKKEPVDEGK